MIIKQLKGAKVNSTRRKDPQITPGPASNDLNLAPKTGFGMLVQVSPWNLLNHH